MINFSPLTSLGDVREVEYRLRARTRSRAGTGHEKRESAALQTLRAGLTLELQKLTRLPLDGVLAVGVEDGKVIQVDELTTHEPLVVEEAGGILHRMRGLCDQFARAYPRLGFRIHLDQQLLITRVVR
jgi:hypothetical protein